MSSELHGIDTLARFSRLRVEAEASGGRVVATREWPAKARRFDLAFLMSPGHSGLAGVSEFTKPQVEDIVALTCAGGRAVIVTDIGQPQQHRAVNALLRDLHVGIRVSPERLPVEHVDAFEPSPLTRGLDHLAGHGLARLELNGTATSLIRSRGGTPWALDFTPRCAGRPGAGEIVVLGDLDLLDDAAATAPGNAARWRRLVANLLPNGAWHHFASPQPNVSEVDR